MRAEGYISMMMMMMMVSLIFTPFFNDIHDVMLS
jgi:hypothetical protein